MDNRNKVNPGLLAMFKWQPAQASYSPASAWSSLNRFRDGTFKTLYLAESPRGALGEFLRRNPEFLEFQSELRIEIYQIEVDVHGECLDLRTEELCVLFGVSISEVTRSDVDETTRYEKCRQIGSETRAKGLTGIFYPSAAILDTFNLALFDDPSAAGWEPLRWFEVDLPAGLKREDITVIA